MSDDPYAAVAARLFDGAKLNSKVRLTGGVSADVYKLELVLAEGSARHVVLREHGATHSGHPAKLEYQLLQALHQSGVAVPEPLLIDVSGTLLANPYLLMAYVEGTSQIAAAELDRHIDLMADALSAIHSTPVDELPALPARNDPLPEVFDFLPEASEWQDLRDFIGAMSGTAYTEAPTLLHGDFWPENLLWRDGAIAAILDWEDAALGDPLSDVAACRVELRYKYGTPSMQRFTAAYAKHWPVDQQRLALWQVYVAAAAQRFMGAWGLPAAREAHMRKEALASIREAAATLMGQTT